MPNGLKGHTATDKLFCSLHVILRLRFMRKTRVDLGSNSCISKEKQKNIPVQNYR